MRSYKVLAKPRYYRDRAGDFLIVVGVWREDGRISRYDGAAAVTIGKASQVIGWEFSGGYLHRCHRVDAAAVPAVWHQALDRYIEKGVAACGS